MTKCGNCERIKISSKVMLCSQCGKDVCPKCVCVRSAKTNNRTTALALCWECFIDSLTMGEVNDFITKGRSRRFRSQLWVNDNARKYLKKHEHLVKLLIKRRIEFLRREINIWERVQPKTGSSDFHQAAIYEKPDDGDAVYTVDEKENDPAEVNIYQVSSSSKASPPGRPVAFGSSIPETKPVNHDNDEDEGSFKAMHEGSGSPRHTGLGVTGVTKPVQEISVQEHLRILLGKKHKYYRSFLKHPPNPLEQSTLQGKQRIHDLFVITRSGLLIAHYQRSNKKPVVDEDIMAGMLIAFQQFIMDSMNVDSDSLREFKFGNFTVLISSGDYVNLVVIMSGPSPESFRVQIDQAIKEIEVFHYGVLRTWSGNMDEVKMVDQYIQKLIRGDYATSN